MIKAEQMYVLINARAASGKTVVHYYEEQDIFRAKCNYWQLRCKREQVTDQFDAADLLLKMDAANACLQ